MHRYCGLVHTTALHALRSLKTHLSGASNIKVVGMAPKFRQHCCRKYRHRPYYSRSIFTVSTACSSISGGDAIKYMVYVTGQSHIPSPSVLSSHFARSYFIRCKRKGTFIARNDSRYCKKQRDPTDALPVTVL